MTNKKATDQAVFAAAEALLAEGLEPSLKLLQARTGGSYTTVQDAVARWKQARAADQQQEPPPPAVTATAEQFTRMVWSLAKEQSELGVQEARRAASLAAESAREELTHAQDQIREVEQERDALNRQLEEVRATLERERARAESDAKRLEHLEVELTRCTQALDQARLEAQGHLVRGAALEGQCEALDKQLSELLEAIRGTSGNAKAKKAGA